MVVFRSNKCTVLINNIFYFLYVDHHCEKTKVTLTTVPHFYLIVFTVVCFWNFLNNLHGSPLLLPQVHLFVLDGLHLVYVFNNSAPVSHQFVSPACSKFPHQSVHKELFHNNCLFLSKCKVQLSHNHWLSVSKDGHNLHFFWTYAWVICLQETF